jgi:membrane-bound serine protease (ClpP class)
VVLGAVGLGLVGAAALVSSPAGAATDPCARHGCIRALSVTGLIDPIVVRFVDEAVDEANATPNIVGVVLELDSPGSVVSDAELNRFAARLVDSKVPVSAWVGTGSQASGGAGEILAVLGETSMAPGSAMGDVGQQRLSVARFGDLFSGRKAKALDHELSAGEARDVGLVDRIAPTIGDHMVGLDGVKTQTVKEHGQLRRKPLTSVVISKLDLGDQLFHTVASPSVAYLCLAVAIGLLIFEFFTAGVGVVGLVGAVAAVLAGYGLGILPHRSWALVLAVLAGLAFMIDVQAGVPRFWTMVGVTAWVVGSVFLFGEVGHPWIALTVGILGMAVAMISGMPAMVRARFGTPTIGREWMIGEEGEAVSAVSPDGVVRIQGASWRARTNRATPIDAGAIVRVVAIDGLTLEVEPEEGGAIDYREMRGRRRDGKGSSTGATTDAG